MAARGLDIPNVAHVVNYDLPSDIDDYGMKSLFIKLSHLSSPPYRKNRKSWKQGQGHGLFQHLARQEHCCGID